MLAGQIIIGASTSTTVTTTEQVLELPVASIARQTTTEVPLGNAEPFVGPLICDTVGAGKEQLSDTDGGANATFAEQTPESVLRTMGVTQVGTGGTASVAVSTTSSWESVHGGFTIVQRSV